MFKRLSIKNFQSHANTEIEFSPGVNVIQGLSFTGKTAILRAMRLLLENRPQGAHYFSDFAGNKGSTEISLELFDGKTVSLEKKIHIHKKNGKVLDESIYKMDGWESAAPSSGIPDQIDQVLNMSELNMQKQFDEPFLVMSSPGEIARIVNKITKLEDVDGWVSEVTSQVNQNNRDLVRLNSEIGREEIALKKYDDLEETEKLINALSKNNEELRAFFKATMDLDTKLEHLEEICRDSEKIEEYLLAEKYVNKAENYEKEIAIHTLLQAQIEKWELYTSQIEKRENDALEFKILVDKLEVTDWAELGRQGSKLAIAISNFEKLEKSLANILIALSAEKECNEISDIQAFVVFFDDLETATDKFNSICYLCEGLAGEIKAAKKEYADLWKEMKTCPVCLSSISEKQIGKIMETL
ncbi:MAG: AAA family ATPase [Sulfuricurvum sp.]|jgi:predicted ATP-dependent endonuclease of OLD family|nr:AAA family ATPase [Sulfuricurvum sp.]